MAGSKVSDYAIGDENLDNIMLTLDKAYKGFMALSLTEMDSTTVPAIAAGSWAEDNGALFKFDTEEAISTTDPVTSSTVADGTVFVCLVPSASTITAAFTATSPTWSDSKQGWYGTGSQANNRYTKFAMNKSTAAYTNKDTHLDFISIEKAVVYASSSGYFDNSTGSASSLLTKSIDLWGDFSDSTHLFTVPRNGFYEISAYTYTATSETEPLFYAVIPASGIVVLAQYQSTQTYRAGQGTISAQGKIYLSSGTTLQLTTAASIVPVSNVNFNYYVIIKEI